METLLVKHLSKPEIVGNSKEIRIVMESCRKSAKDKTPVLFQGEIGTGKLLMATYLHSESERLGHPFLLVDCTSESSFSDFLSNSNNLERKLKFFTGGTIYFREVASLSLSEQSQLYHSCRIAESLNIRILLSSSQNVHLLIYEKAFNADLYRYGTQREIYISPLRQRKDDIIALTSFFLKSLNLSLRKSIQGLTPQAEEVFLTYRWPGNVEELQQVLTRAMVICNESFIGQRHLAESIGQMGDNFMHSSDVIPLDRMEEILLRSALNRYGLSLEGKKKAARALNISLATLYNKVKRYNLNE